MAPTLPSGTVTFLFSDIEGSTRLLQRLGPRYAEALDEHQRLLRAVWLARQGIEVDTQGDSFFVAFSRASDAVAAAVDATRALAAHTWPDGAELSVRIGLHTGAPALTGGRYVGLDVHRAARIAAAGHGGQTLLSQTTRDLCEDDLPEDVLLRDMGETRLKDLQRPEHLYQIVLPDLRHEFPPLKTLDRVRNNLPLQLTPFVGRQDTIQRIAALLNQPDVRALTLAGPGGIGKTRVALEVAALVAEQFPDGVYFVALAPLNDSALVTTTIVRALGYQRGGQDSAEERLQTILGQQRVLLVLDNFESVLAAAPLVARLLAACPNVKALVTSRIALRLRGEHKFMIPPLETPAAALLDAASATSQADGAQRLEEASRYPAVALFVERAREMKPDFQLTSANASAVADICRQLDGLPLAIELAAARVRVLSPQAIRSRLSQQLELLTDGPTDQPERQQTMRATIGWSYDLLDANARSIFRRLAVFVGGWTLAAGEAICGSSLDTLAGLSALIDQSLIMQRDVEDDDEPRFSQLETIRAFAAEALEADAEAEGARSAHGRYYLALAERTQHESRGPQAQLWLKRLEREHANFRAALVWARDHGELTLGLRLATALSGFWHSHGHEREGAAWLEELLALADPQINERADAPPELRAAYAWGLGREGALRVYLAEYERASALLERSLAMERALGDRERELRILNMLGVTAQLRDDLPVALGWYEEGLPIARAAGLDDLTTTFLNNIGDLAYYQGDFERAAQCYTERLRFSEGSGDQAGVTVGHQNLGRTLLRQGQIQDAAIALRQSLVGAWLLHDPRRLAEGLEGLAALAGACDEGERAARLLGAAEHLRETLGTPQPAPERADTQSAVADARARFGADAWQAALSAGRGASLEQVIQSECGAESADD